MSILAAFLRKDDWFVFNEVASLETSKTNKKRVKNLKKM
jgi:hypothetical protein